jgi:Tol biopolymer transport system component
VIVAVYAGGRQYVATAGKPRPRPSQRFRIGSLTKAFTATIVLQLVDEGKIRLGDALEAHLPGVVPRGKEITIHDLLQDRSGLVSYTNYTSWLRDASRSPETRPIDLLRFAASKPLLFDPGSRNNYSNTDWLALGLVVEAVTGNSWADELERRIIRPFGLAATEQPKTRLLPDLGNDGTVPPFMGIPKGDPVYDVDWANPVVSWAGGGIVSNARDISRFFSALLARRLLSDASLAKMKAIVPAGPDLYSGLGILATDMRCGRSWGTNGQILAYWTSVSVSEKHDRIGVISLKGEVSIWPPDLSRLVCAELRLAATAATSKLTFVRGDGVYVVNGDGSGQRPLMRAVGAGRDFAWSPDGSKLAFVQRNDLWAAKADGRLIRRLSNDPVGDTDPAWSPDGKRIVFVREGDLYVVPGKGGGRWRLTRGTANDSHPIWSPDGRQVAFVRQTGKSSDIYVVDADGKGERNLTGSSEVDEAPAWSPDGRRIVFVRKVAFAGVGGNYEIFVMDADGSGQRRLTVDPRRDAAPVWSPDGRKVAFETSSVFGGPQIRRVFYGVYVVNADGARRLPLARDGRSPRWSPDGKNIAFLSTSGAGRDVYVMNADGSGQTNLTHSKASESWLAWVPARRR